MSNPLIIADPALLTPEDRPYWTTPEMGAELMQRKDGGRLRLSFGVQEVAKLFFGMSPGWVREQLKQRHEIDGEPFVPRRTHSDYRYFLLHDIEVWAHALASAGVIDGRHLELVIVAVKNTARLHKFIA